MSIKQPKNIGRIVSGNLQAELDLESGGKICRLISIKSKRNFFFKDPRHSPQGKKYIQHDISGFDECFPCVGKSPGRFGMDHGVLWDIPWQAYRQGGRIISGISRPHGMPIIFTRIISKSGPHKIHLDYTILNTGKKNIPFIYSAHPILALDVNSRIKLAGVKNLSVSGHNGLLKSSTRQNWPVAVLKNGSQARLDTNISSQRKLAGKWFAKDISAAKITFPSTHEYLTLSWDHEKLPYMGLWLSLGISLDKSDTPGKQWNCVALEPCTHDQDIINPGKTPDLMPGAPFSFWIEWKLSSQEKSDML